MTCLLSSHCKWGDRLVVSECQLQSHCWGTGVMPPPWSGQVAPFYGTSSMQWRALNNLTNCVTQHWMPGRHPLVELLCDLMEWGRLLPRPIVGISDTSGTWGYGVFLPSSGEWLLVWWPGYWKCITITAKELLPVVLGCSSGVLSGAKALCWCIVTICQWWNPFKTTHPRTLSFATCFEFLPCVKQWGNQRQKHTHP